MQGVENQSRKKHRNVCVKTRTCFSEKSYMFLYLQPIITQYFIDNKSEIWLLFLIAHSKR